MDRLYKATGHETHPILPSAGWVTFLRGIGAFAMAFAIALTVLLVPIAMAHSANVNALTPISSSGLIPYEYPVKPGTPAWATLTSHDEMLEASQLPTEALQLGTDALVTTVLNYPLFSDYRAHDNLQQGFNRMAAAFNGLVELLARRDAGAKLLARYRAFDPLALDQSWSLEQKGAYVFAMGDMEFLLAQEPILATLSADERTALLAESLDKASAKVSLVEVYGHSGLESTALLAGRTLKLDQGGSGALTKTVDGIDAFLARGIVTSPETLTG